MLRGLTELDAGASGKGSRGPQTDNVLASLCFFATCTRACRPHRSAASMYSITTQIAAGVRKRETCKELLVRAKAG